MKTDLNVPANPQIATMNHFSPCVNMLVRWLSSLEECLAGLGANCVVGSFCAVGGMAAEDSSMIAGAII